MVLVQTHLRQLGKLLGSCCGINGSGDAGMPGQHPIDIAIHQAKLAMAAAVYRPTPGRESNSS